MSSTLKQTFLPRHKHFNQFYMKATVFGSDVAIALVGILITLAVSSLDRWSSASQMNNARPTMTDHFLVILALRSAGSVRSFCRQMSL
jgi:hypothetical protein